MATQFETQADPARAHGGPHVFPAGALLQRKCPCGAAANLTGECSECQSRRLIGKPLQAKLRIGEAGDEYEREADRVADQVMRTAESNQQSEPGQLGAAALVQRRIAGDGTENIQRQEETPGTDRSVEAVSQTEGGEGNKDESPCASWFNDPQSISKRAAEHYVRNDMTPPSQATVEGIDCEPPRANGNYGCHVHFSDGLVIRVIVRKQDIVVGTAPINTWTPPPATPLCFYDYACPEQDLVLTKRECRSARPAGPTTIVQRAARGGGTMDAAPLVGNVLSSTGQPLDADTRRFFAVRFGHDFANVRVHADGAAAASAHSVNALAYTVGQDIVFGAGQYAPNTSAGKRLLAHELTHVVQQGGASPGAADSNTAHPSGDAAANSSKVDQSSYAGLIQRQPEPESKLRDLPLFLDKLELNVGKNLLDYGHHLYQAAALHPDEPEILQEAFSRYALGLNVLKTSFRYAGFKGDTADKLAIGTGILFKGLSLVRKGEFVLDFQVDIGRGVKFETNIGLGVNPQDPTDVRKADVRFGFVRRF